MEKVCTICGTLKSYSEFNKSGGKRGHGLRGECKTCANSRNTNPIIECKRCGRELPNSAFNLLPRYNAKGICKECRKAPILNSKGQFTPNNVRYEDNYAYIELTDKNLRPIAEAIISRSDVDRVIAFCRWHATPEPNTTYVTGRNRKARRNSGISLHRFLMEAGEGVFVDHINRNGLDNRRENLRLVTPGESVQNRGIAGRTSKSGVRNVVWSTQAKKWAVRIKVGGKLHHFGFFTSVEEAAPVALAARRQLHTHCPERSQERIR